MIPAFEEAAAVGTVIENLRGAANWCELLVVDDGSNDGTAAAATAAGARVIRHPYNKGNGASVKTGIRHAAGEYVLVIDGDGQHSAEDALRLVACLGEYDLVVTHGPADTNQDHQQVATEAKRVFKAHATLLGGEFPNNDLGDFRPQVYAALSEREVAAKARMVESYRSQNFGGRPYIDGEMVRALATEHTDRQIAETLNARWLRTGTGQRFTRLRVRHVRLAHEIPSLAEHLRQAGWLTPTEVATQLGVHPSTATRFAREGVLQALRADDGASLLFAPLTGPLPRAHPGKRFRDRRRYPQCPSHTRKELQYEA